MREDDAFIEEGTTNILEMGGIVLEIVNVMVASDQNFLPIETL